MHKHILTYYAGKEYIPGHIKPGNFGFWIARGRFNFMNWYIGPAYWLIWYCCLIGFISRLIILMFYGFLGTSRQYRHIVYAILNGKSTEENPKTQYKKLISVGRDALVADMQENNILSEGKFFTRLWKTASQAGQLQKQQDMYNTMFSSMNDGVSQQSTPSNNDDLVEE